MINPEDRPDIYEEPNCPVCNTVQRSQLYQRTKRTESSLGDVTISVAQCSQCGFVYNSPRVRDAILKDYYLYSPLASGQVFRDESARGYYPQLNAARAKFLSSFLESRKNCRLLDIGCGVGGFLDALKATGIEGWEFFGMEPSRNACDAARLKGYAVEHACLAEDSLPEKSFDAISLVSVLEHLLNPREALARVHQLLKPDGIIYVEVPNLLKPEISLSGCFSLEHIQHFTPASLADLLQSFGITELVSDAEKQGSNLRIAGSKNLSAWGGGELEIFSSDRKLADKIIRQYAHDEGVFLQMLDVRVRAVLDAWRNAKRKVAIYGAGIHTIGLTAYFDLQNYCDCFLDGDPKKHGTEFLGLSVHSPAEIIPLEIDCILVSSQRFQDEIVRKIRETAGEKVEIAVCYDESTIHFIQQQNEVVDGYV